MPTLWQVLPFQFARTKFKLETDHKPLVPLLSTKDLVELPARIQRFKMRLMRFDFSISHVAGKDLLDFRLVSA
jgi:hypothetical protein